MKKILFLLAFSLLFLVSTNGASAAGNQNNHYPTDEEIEALNEELQRLVVEANKRLANGEKDIEVQSENVKLGLKERNVIDPVNLKGNQLNSAGMTVTASAIGSKEYQAYVANTSGWNFTHAVSGVFSWDGDLLTAVSASADLTGVMYSRSSNTTKEGLDGRIGATAKVARVTSKGTFTPVKYWPTSKYTTLMVDVYAPTKSYRIIEAKIIN
jgi:hypothetical protein